MDLDLIKTFIEVKNCRHFGKAAENLYLTQAAVSSRIRQLEQYFGTALFTRNRNNIRLTAAGEKFVSYAESMLQSLQLAKHDISLIQDEKDMFSIGGTPNSWDVYIHQALNVIFSECPSLAVVADVYSREQLTRQLLEKNLDMAILFDPPKVDELVLEKLSSLELIAVSTQNNAEHIDNNYFQLDWGSSFNLWHSKHVILNKQPRLRTSSARVALELLLSNGGSAYLPKTLVAPYLATNQLYQLALPKFNRDVYIAYHKTMLTSDALQSVRAILLNIKPNNE